MTKTFQRKVVNGRRYQILALPGTDMFQFEIVNLLGSNIERAFNEYTGKNVYGMSHFIEHLGFRNPRDYTTNELLTALKEEGTYNASTDHDRINYWFRTTSAKAGRAINLVCNYALNDLRNISTEEFETEKKVVYNEAKRYADDDQTMFYFNTVPTLCKYHEQDNVLGIPEVIDTFTQEDTIRLKELFLNCGEQIYNITYDPAKLNVDDLLNMVEEEVQTFKIAPAIVDFDADKAIMTLHDNLLSAPVVGHFNLENESEQAMTALLMDVVDNVITARVGNSYISDYSTTSLTDIIREQNGLTYGLSFHDDLVAYTPYTHYSVDVSMGTEGLMMELFQDSINRTVDGYNEELHAKLLETRDLQRVLRNMNLGAYLGLHWTSIWHHEIVELYEADFAEDIDKARVTIEEHLGSYDRVVDYMKLVQKAVNEKEYSLLTN